MNTKELLDKAVELQGERTALEKKNKALQAKVNKLEKQLLLYGVTFCLPLENQTFEDWVNTNFTTVNKHYFECITQATVHYNHTQIMEIYGFLTDRLVAN